MALEMQDLHGFSRGAERQALHDIFHMPCFPSDQGTCRWCSVAYFSSASGWFFIFLQQLTLCFLSILEMGENYRFPLALMVSHIQVDPSEPFRREGQEGCRSKSLGLRKFSHLQEKSSYTILCIVFAAPSLIAGWLLNKGLFFINEYVDHFAEIRRVWQIHSHEVQEEGMDL